MPGPCKNETNYMQQSIVASSGYVIIRWTVRSLRTSELHSETKKKKWQTFNDIILKKIGDLVNIQTSPNSRYHAPYSYAVDPNYAQLTEDNDPFMPEGAAVFNKPVTDQYIHAELNLPPGELLQKAKFLVELKIVMMMWRTHMTQISSLMLWLIMLSFLMVRSKSARLM